MAMILPQMRPIDVEERDVNFHIVRAIGQCDRSDEDEILPLLDVVAAIATAPLSH